MLALFPRRRFQSEDDLLNERGYDAQTGQMTSDAMTLDRRENGAHMVPPPPNEYETYEDLKNQQQQVSCGLLCASQTDSMMLHA